jgi:hypothetical protein
MSIDELETEALKLDSSARARLAERLLRSLDELSAAETERLWAEEALRRDAEMDRDPAASRPGDDVLRDARARLL